MCLHLMYNQPLLHQVYRWHCRRETSVNCKSDKDVETRIVGSVLIVIVRIYALGYATLPEARSFREGDTLESA